MASVPAPILPQCGVDDRRCSARNWTVAGRRSIGELPSLTAARLTARLHAEMVHGLRQSAPGVKLAYRPRVADPAVVHVHLLPDEPVADRAGDERTLAVDRIRIVPARDDVGGNDRERYVCRRAYVDARLVGDPRHQLCVGSARRFDESRRPRLPMAMTSAGPASPAPSGVRPPQRHPNPPCLIGSPGVEVAQLLRRGVIAPARPATPACATPPRPCLTGAGRAAGPGTRRGSGPRRPRPARPRC